MVPVPAAASTVVGQLVRAPVMVTLPGAYILAQFLADALHLGVLFAPLVASLVVYFADLYVGHTQGEKYRGVDYAGRFIYVIFNTAILWALLTGVATIGETDGGAGASG